MPVLLLVANLASAAEPAPRSASPYEVDWVVDGGLFLALQAVLWGSDVGASAGIETSERCRKVDADTHCDPAALGDLDRRAVGNNSEAWREMSDWGLRGSFLLAAAATGALSLSAPTDQWWQDWAADALVIAVATNSAALATQVMKFAYGRPRPLQYSAVTYRRWPDRERSFPSGHVTSTAAASTALAMTVAYRLPESPLRWVAALGAAALTGLVAQGRVGGGMHFYTDVAAGAAVGVAAGLLVPRAYRRAELTLAPLPAAGGGGLALTVNL